MKTLTTLCMVLIAPALMAEPLRVASLNPILSDFARQVGGEYVQVIDLMPIGSSPHRFYPSPAHLKDAARSQLVLAAGKGLEPYLEEFSESLGAAIPVFEVGDAVPSLTLTSTETFVCCPDHAREREDPHWWHSLKNAKRASTAIAERLAEIDPDHGDAFKQQARDYATHLDALSRWARKSISKIPRRDRELTTAHAAFSYFCREFGLRSITIQGLSTEENPAPDYLKDVVKTLREEQVVAVFPEQGANPTVIASMVDEAGVKVGGALYAGSLPPDAPTYEGLIRHNVSTIVEALHRAR